MGNRREKLGDKREMDMRKGMRGRRELTVYNGCMYTLVPRYLGSKTL